MDSHQYYVVQRQHWIFGIKDVFPAFVTSYHPVDDFAFPVFSLGFFLVRSIQAGVCYLSSFSNDTIPKVPLRSVPVGYQLCHDHKRRSEYASGLPDNFWDVLRFFPPWKVPIQLFRVPLLLFHLHAGDRAVSHHDFFLGYRKETPQSGVEGIELGYPLSFH